MKQAQKGADVRKNILIAFACITVLAILAYVGNQYLLRKNGFSPAALSAAQLETGTEGRVQLTLDALQGPFAAQEPDLYYYFFLPQDGEEGRIAVIALRPYYVSESSVEAPATDILYYVLFGGLYLAWFVYAWVALENVQKEET